MSDTDSFTEGEISKLCQKALYVDPLSRQVDLNTVPINGHEFIIKSKLEDASLEFPEFKSDIKPNHAENKVLNNIIKPWIKTRYYPLNSEIKKNKTMLQNTYKSAVTIPLEDEVECCNFCLGSEVCASIYDSKELSSPTKPHLPLLSYIMQLNRAQSINLITYLHKWFDHIGMSNTICMWMFVIFVCLHKPLSESEDDLLEDIYDDCIERIKICKVGEYTRLYLITTILSQHYCIKSYTIGSTLWPVEC